MQIEMWPIERVKPYPGNPRQNDAAVDAVAASLREFGWRQPIVVDADGVIVVGHTRHRAALKIGLTQVPVHVAKDLTAAQVRAYRLADNATNELAEWDMTLLPIELSALRDARFDVNLLGFDADELARLMGGDVTDGLCDPDEVPAPPDEAITKPGDLWVLGDHRLLCGDSSSAADVDRLLAGQPVHLVNTDPPYNVQVEPRSVNAVAAGHTTYAGSLAPGATRGRVTAMRAKDRPIANDQMSDEQYERLLNDWFGNISRVLLPGHGFYLWGGYSNCGRFPAALAAHQMYFSQTVIWVKEHPTLNRKDFMANHEWCFYGWRAGAAHRFYGPNNAADVWSVKKVSPQRMVHLTEKPVELAVRAMRYSSLTGENVLDLFGGSGSTLIGAEQTGRRAYLMELDPLYCDVIVQRYERFTGRTAERAPAGEAVAR